ncbi:MAG: peptide chain release factor 1 [Verrucomicrobiales bacterium]|nr:peptide chain release factor 1 [Verrucomicrobiales bacterium]MEC9035748.1 peptide chain release factor 1 [Verrucomicrobiota bacterium]|tara:strand:+ start:2161 stop:3237 length:1077 start_codon:yes stop_codon:yes gene_type:complete
MDFEPLIDKKKERLAELEGIMSAEDFYSDPKQAAEISREYNYIKKLLEDWDLFSDSRRQLKDNHELVKGDDEEMAALAQEEIPDLESSCEKLELQIQYALLPQDKTEDRDAIVEIRAGTGGDEASLFAGDLYRMYQRFSELNGWKLEPLESSPSEVGGFKEITVKVSGEEVFRRLKYESGVHRVQRVPETETQGRIHTSTATVAVMPEAEDVDIELRPDELNIQATRSGGPGGQHVNTTDSCIQVTHLPTGIMVRCQDGRSQTKNKEKALTILRSKLLEAKQREEAEKYSEQRRNLIGSGGREEKIRTYNFPQNRVTDHRIGLTLHNLEGVLTGQVEELVEALQASEMAERLQEAGLK